MKIDIYKTFIAKIMTRTPLNTDEIELIAKLNNICYGLEQELISIFDCLRCVEKTVIYSED